MNTNKKYMLGAGLLLLAIVFLGPKIGLFSVYTNPATNFLYPDECVQGEVKCLPTNSTGTFLKKTCSRLNYQNGTFYKYFWGPSYSTNDCTANILSGLFYRLSENCQQVNIKIADKLSVDYPTLSKCLQARANPCTNIGEEKCDGKTLLICTETTHFPYPIRYVVQGITLNKCGVECFEEKCDGQNHFDCTDNKFVGPHLINGTCGYVGDSNYSSSSSSSSSSGSSSSSSSSSGGGIIPTINLGQTLFNLGDFEVKIWMIIALGALLILLALL